MSIGTRCRSHVKSRLQSRYGLTLSFCQIRDLARKIQKGQSEFVRFGNPGREIHKVHAHGSVLLLVYWPEKRTLVTALSPPEDWKARTVANS